MKEIKLYVLTNKDQQFQSSLIITDGYQNFEIELPELNEFIKYFDMVTIKFGRKGSVNIVPLYIDGDFSFAVVDKLEYDSNISTSRTYGTINNSEILKIHYEDHLFPIILKRITPRIIGEL